MGTQQAVPQWAGGFFAASTAPVNPLSFFLSRSSQPRGWQQEVYLFLLFCRVAHGIQE